MAVCEINQWRQQDFKPGGAQRVRVHEITQKSQKFLHKYNKHGKLGIGLTACYTILYTITETVVNVSDTRVYGAPAAMVIVLHRNVQAPGGGGMCPGAPWLVTPMR